MLSRRQHQATRYIIIMMMIIDTQALAAFCVRSCLSMGAPDVRAALARKRAVDLGPALLNRLAEMIDY